MEGNSAIYLRANRRKHYRHLPDLHYRYYCIPGNQVLLIQKISIHQKERIYILRKESKKDAEE